MRSCYARNRRLALLTLLYHASILQPNPLYIQLAVRHCLLSLITFDAVITYAVRDIYWAALILVLVVPMTILSRWSYSS